MSVLLALPAIVVTVVLLRHLVRHRGRARRRRPAATTGAASAWSPLALGLVMGGLVAIRRARARTACCAWLLVAARPRGARAVRPLRARPRRADDRRPAAAPTPGQWPVQLTAFLFGMSVLGAQIPLSTFARTDPDVAGYGLGADASLRLDPDRRLRRLPGDRRVHPAADLAAARRRAAPWCSSPLLVALGYALWLPFHDTTGAGAGQHGDRRPRLRRPGRRAARGRRGRGAARPHRLRDRHDQRDQDRRRRDRLVDLRDRAGRRPARSTDPDEGHAPLSGYLTVWAICAVAALVAAVALLLMPRQAPRTAESSVTLADELDAARHLAERRL